MNRQYNKKVVFKRMYTSDGVDIFCDGDEIYIKSLLHTISNTMS